MTVSSLLLPLLQEEVITHWSAEIIQRVYKEPLLPPIRSMLSNGLLSEGGMAPCVVSLPIVNSIIASDEEKTCMDGLLCFFFCQVLRIEAKAIKRRSASSASTV